MSRLARLRESVREGVAERVTGRVTAATGLVELSHLEEAVDSLEVAAAENRDLEVALAGLVDRLERDVAEVVARRSGTEVAP